jgi:hypothetical protein
MIIKKIDKPINIKNKIISLVKSNSKLDINFNEINNIENKNIELILNNTESVKFFLRLKYELLINILDNYSSWKNKDNLIIVASELDKCINLNISYNEDIEEDVINLYIDNIKILNKINLDNDNDFVLKIKYILFNENKIIPIFEMIEK